MHRLEAILTQQGASYGDGKRLAARGHVALADGSAADLSSMTREELLRLQWQQEREFAARILASPKGSRARAEAMGQAYDTVPRILAAAWGSSDKPLVMGLDPRYEQVVLKLLRRQQGRGLKVRFFEIGYGSGVLLQRVCEAGFPAVGLEVSEALREEACRLLGAGSASWLHRGDLLHFEFPASQRPMSLVYWNDVIEHIPPDETLDYLRRIHELLAPGGALVTVTPNWHMRPSDVTCLFCPPRTEAAGVHLKEYTLREMTRLLTAAGFRRVATPWMVTPRRMLFWGNGLAGLKRWLEPALEWMPFRLARLLCRGFGLSVTIASKAAVQQ